MSGSPRGVKRDADGNAVGGNPACTICYEGNTPALYMWVCWECSNVVCPGCHDQLQDKTKCPMCNTKHKFLRAGEALQRTERAGRRLRMNLNMLPKRITAYLSPGVVESMLRVLNHQVQPGRSLDVLLELLILALQARQFGECVVKLATKLQEYSFHFRCDVCDHEEENDVGNPPACLIANTCLCEMHVDEAKGNVAAQLHNFSRDPENTRDSYTEAEIRTSGAGSIRFKNGFHIYVPADQIKAQDQSEQESTDRVEFVQDSKRFYAAPAIEGMKAALETAEKLRNAVFSGRYSPTYNPQSPVPSFTPHANSPPWRPIE